VYRNDNLLLFLLYCETCTEDYAQEQIVSYLILSPFENNTTWLLFQSMVVS